jgi:glyoxylase-like metal-dependent hydrolase (beta-lactamase superfamily II)
MIKRIGDNIVLIQLSDIDSNIYIIGDTVIDSGTGFNFTRLHTLLKMLGKSLESFSQVINTHSHFDHIGGNGYFTEAKIAAHEEDAKVIENADEKGSYAEFFEGHLHPRKVETKLKDGDVIEGLKVIHTPGHTPGSICLLDEKKGILFSGDTIFSDGVGRTDMPGGDEEALSKSIELVSGLKYSKILPGHGEPILENASKVIADMLKAPTETEPEAE